MWPPAGRAGCAGCLNPAGGLSCDGSFNACRAGAPPSLPDRPGTYAVGVALRHHLFRSHTEQQRIEKLLRDDLTVGCGHWPRWGDALRRCLRSSRGRRIRGGRHRSPGYRRGPCRGPDHLPESIPFAENSYQALTHAPGALGYSSIDGGLRDPLARNASTARAVFEDAPGQPRSAACPYRHGRRVLGRWGDARPQMWEEGGGRGAASETGRRGEGRRWGAGGVGRRWGRTAWPRAT